MKAIQPQVLNQTVVSVNRHIMVIAGRDRDKISICRSCANLIIVVRTPRFNAAVRFQGNTVIKARINRYKIIAVGGPSICLTEVVIGVYDFGIAAPSDDRALFLSQTNCRNS